MITVYSRPGCTRCDDTKRWLDKLGHTYRAVDLDTDTEAQNTVAALGFTALPVVVTPTDAWAGFRPDKIRGL